MSRVDFKNINKEIFEKKYLSGEPILDLVKFYGVSEVSINNWRRTLKLRRKRVRLDLSTRNRNKDYFGKSNPAWGCRKLSWLTKGTLKKLYKKYGTYRKTAKAIGCCPNTIKKMMFELNIPIKKGRRCKFPKSLLEELYFVKGMNIEEIGDAIGVDGGSVALNMRSYGIKYHARGEWTKQDHFWKPGQRERVRKRDGYICQVCGTPQKKYGKKLAVHHVFYDVSYDGDRCLVSCCNSCHSRTNGNKTHWARYFIERMSEKYSYVYDDILKDMNEGGELKEELFLLRENGNNQIFV